MIKSLQTKKKVVVSMNPDWFFSGIPF